MICHPRSAPRRSFLPTAAARSFLLLLLRPPTFFSAAASSPALPNIDWSALGQVALVGSFSGLSLFNSSAPAGLIPQSSSLSDNRSQNAYPATLLSLDLSSSSAPPQLIATTNPSGEILTICHSSTSSKVFVGGRFSSLNSVPNTLNLAILDSSTLAITPFHLGLDGPIHAISCAQDNQIWIGGQFSDPLQNSTSNSSPNLALWNNLSSQWEPFQVGLPSVINGPIWSIVHLTSPTGDSLLIGGQFSFTTASTLSAPASSGGSVVSTTSLGRIAYGSSLVPILFSNDTSFSASPPSSATGFEYLSNVFCPKAADGPGSSWQLDQNFDNGVINIELGRSVQAGGIRLGNSFSSGGGTAGFHVVATPDNIVLQMSFVDPVTDQVSVCQYNCTLSRDLKIDYQDYLFPPSTSLTGIQLVITSKYGRVAGLHLLQILSSGNVAYAVDSLNNPGGSLSQCRTGTGAISGSNSAQTTGAWQTVSVNSDTPATVSSVLTSSATAGTTPQSGPSLTWSIWVPQSGSYVLSLVVPGCSGMGDCPSRAQLSVIVSSSSSTSVTTRVDTRNPNQQSFPIFNGTLNASSGTNDGHVSVTLRLADTVTSGSGPVTLVADQVILRSTQPQNLAPMTVTGLPTGGVFEYILSGTGAYGDGSNPRLGGTNRNLSATAVDRLGATLTPGSIIKAIAGDQQTVFISGEHLLLATPQSSAVASTKLTVANGGLHGIVRALVAINGTLYAGGDFERTADGTVLGLAGLARWNYQVPGSKWESIDQPGNGRVGSPINSIELVNDFLFIAGTTTPGSDQAVGIYNPRNSSWLESSSLGYYVGNITAISPRVSKSDRVFLAGNLVALAAIRTPSGALFSTPSRVGQQPIIKPFGFGINQTASQSTAILTPRSTLLKIRTIITKRSTINVISDGKKVLQRRTESVLEKRQVRPAEVSNSTGLPAGLTRTTQGTILAGSFWKSQGLLIGGRFVTDRDSQGVLVQNLGIYDLNQSKLKRLNGSQSLVGDVLAIKVVDDTAWIGGDFISPSGKVGLDTYDLMNGTWATRAMAGLAGYPGTNVSVRVIKNRKNSEEILIGGQFQSIGSLPCQSICIWTTSSSQWRSLGDGLKGIVNGMEIMGKNQEELIAYGRFELNQTVGEASIARWKFEGNSGWEPIGDRGDIPGIIKTIGVGELGSKGTDGMFVGGEHSSGTGSFLMSWDGSRWKQVDGINTQRSAIEDVKFVPVRNPSLNVEDSNGVKSDRMLMVSGLIGLNNSSRMLGSVMFDGTTWFPYLISVDTNGGNGIVSRMVSITEGFRSAIRKIHTVAEVILISMSIALGIVFLAVLIGLLIGLRKRTKGNGRQGADRPRIAEEDEEDEPEMRRPSSLLATIDAATAAMTERMVQMRQEDDDGLARMKLDGKGEVDNHDGEAYVEVQEEEGVDVDLRRARWSFEPQLPGEIAVGAGESVEVKDRSNQEWWLVRRADGIEGVVPADWFL